MSSLLVWAALCELIGQLDLPFFVTPVSQVLLTLFCLVQTAAFQSARATTAYSFIIGTGSAFLIGIPLGILMGKTRVLDELLLPWVNIFISAPLTALVPVLMVLFGFGARTITTTALFTI
jgi:NitT/TauT family transport system permease protein